MHSGEDFCRQQKRLTVKVKKTKVTSKTCINTMVTNQQTSVKNLNNIVDKLVLY